MTTTDPPRRNYISARDAAYQQLKQNYTELSARDREHNDKEAWEEFEQDAKAVYYMQKEDMQKPRHLGGASALAVTAFRKKDDTYMTELNREADAFFNREREPKHVGGASSLFRGTTPDPGYPLEKVWYIPFTSWDPAWSWALVEGARHPPSTRVNHYLPPVEGQTYTYPLPKPESGPLKIAIVGDLGTNDRHHKGVLKAISEKKPHIVIHLGDVYISGTIDECNEFWRVYESSMAGPQPPFWCIPGNHEYISAGEGFFKSLLPHLGSSTNKQEASFFCLESEHYGLQILALDTGFNSSNFSLPLSGEQMDYSTMLGEKEAAWAKERLKKARDNKWRTIILTHHQMVSAFWVKNFQASAELIKQLADENPDNNIVAWLWGHEHRMVVLNEDVYVKGSTEGSKIIVRNAHCVGHGAIPEEDGSDGYGKTTPENPAKHNVDYVPDAVPQYRYHFSHCNNIFNNGFVMLEANDRANEKAELKTSYHQVHRVTGACTLKGKDRVID